MPTNELQIQDERPAQIQTLEAEEALCEAARYAGDIPEEEEDARNYSL